MFKPAKTPNAFTFLETMIALLVLVVCLTWLGPIVGRVSVERSGIIESENALTILNNQLNLWTAGRSDLPAEVKQNQTLYHLNWEELDVNTIQLCLRWTNSAERKQVVCGKAKH